MKQKSAAIGKITPPDMPEVITRRRLFDIMDQPRHYRVTWVSATAGSGKTTFAANYLAKRNIPCLWYQIDERDSDVPTFFYYLGLAASRALPQTGNPLPLLTSDKHGNAAVFSQNYFEDLCGRVTPPFVMVFDNYQRIDPVSDFHTIFQKGIAEVSPSIHVLILSRTDPPPAFTGMLANNEIQVIGPESLYLNPEETAAIFERETGVPPSTEMVQKLHQKTQGWAAGVVLMAKYIHKEKIAPEKWDTYLPTVVYDYFAAEFFNALDDAVKDFLLISSYVPVITESTIRSLTDQVHAGEILLDLYRNHIFIERFSASETMYQYHPLFREFLLAKARDTFDLHKITQLRQNAASQMEKAGRIEDASEIYSQINDADALARLVHTHGASLIAQGRLEILHQWLKWIPENKLSENPWLLFWMGMSFSPARAQEARACFEKAFTVFNQKKEWIGLYLSWSRIIDSIILAWDDFRALDKWINWFNGHPPIEQILLPAEIMARLAASLIGALIIRKPDHPELVHWLEKALDLSRKTSDNLTRLKVGIWAVTYYMWIGEFDKALIFKNKADSSMQNAPDSPVALMFWQWLDISADIRSMTSPENALAQVMDLLEEADKKGAHQMDQMLFPPGVFAALVLGDFAKAKILLDRFDSKPEDSHLHGLVIFHHFKGLYCLLKGLPNEALAHADTALMMVQKTGYVFYETLCHFQMAHIRHGMGMMEKAEEHLKTAHDLAVKTNSRILEFMCLLKKAHMMMAEVKGRNRSKGLDMLSQALVLGRNHDFVVTIWWWDPDMMTELCGEALVAGIETEFVQRIIQTHHLCLKTGQSHIEDWPWAVKIHVLGHFRIQVEGKTMQFKGRSPKKPLELLHVLIAKGGEDVSMDWVMDALWHEAEGDIAQSAFSTTLNRLRTLLKSREAVTINNGKISLNPEYCWVDILAFNRMLEKGDVHWEHGKKKQAVNFYENALKFYAGDFLFEEPAQSWNISIREHTKNSCLTAIIRIGVWLEEAKKFKKAMGFYEKGLSIDDLEESLYQRLMSCQYHLGCPSDVVRTYQRCRKRLFETFKVEPSAETEAIFSRIHN
ncbi:MAG: hypothetical protein KKF30_15305 [Proteobacteria bacterium]|nr:hypothetical protein [Pseudomonadota bacterium]MBU4469694.1 hypothetical protein [Pseudomonadota bacterium]MCG2751777.1 hypothetical protein [Desulfobacteraceae bacterium]